MIQHIVLFRWKPEATSAQIEGVMAGLRELQGQVPGIIAVAAGEDFSGRGQGFTHGAVFRMTDHAALEAYFPHPAHRKLVEEKIQPIREQTLGFDFETLEP